MPTTRAKLVDATAFGGNGPDVSATFARAEFESVLDAGNGPVELQLEVRRNEADVEAHKLDVALERSELKKLLEQRGDMISFTFDARELRDAIEDDVEAHNVRERALVLTVAAATAAAGAGAMFVSQHAANAPSSHFVTPAAAQALQPVSDAASSGGYATVSGPEQVSDAASGGYTQAADQSDALSRYVANTASGPEQVSDAATGGGYTTAPELVSDAATGGYTQAGDQSDALSRYVANTASGPEQVSDAATGGYTQAGDESDALSRYVANTASGPEQMSDAATGGYTASGPEQVSDAATGGGYPTAQAQPGVNLPEAAGAAIAGGMALLITGAAVRRARQ